MNGFLGKGQELSALALALVVVIAFHGLVVAWSKLNFKYSFQWFVLRVVSLGSGRVSRRLEVDSMMNYPHWARFGVSPARTGQGADSDSRSRMGLREGLQ